jgi:hypothetical protein
MWLADKQPGQNPDNMPERQIQMPMPSAHIHSVLLDIQTLVSKTVLPKSPKEPKQPAALQLCEKIPQNMSV